VPPGVGRVWMGPFTAGQQAHVVGERRVLQSDDWLLLCRSAVSLWLLWPPWRRASRRGELRFVASVASDGWRVDGCHGGGPGDVFVVRICLGCFRSSVAGSLGGCPCLLTASSSRWVGVQFRRCHCWSCAL
jgi:hypothetical protein